jgi:uncharacterized membrane-anchored protein
MKPGVEPTPGNRWYGQEHPLRRALIEEMHLRRFPNFSAPARLLQLVIVTHEHEPEAVRAHADALCRRLGAAEPARGKHFAVQGHGFELVWEQHSEFCTYTLIEPGRASQLFDGALVARLPADWLAAQPGKLLRAVQIELLASSDPEPGETELARLFDPEELVSCELAGGQARMWSSFRVHEDGLGRMLIRDQGLVGGGETARLVQRLKELGNYRNMALLGLSRAQALTPELGELERQMTQLTRLIASGASPDAELLQQLSALSADLARIQAESSYRMNATRAYAQLVADRLASLEVRRVRGFPTLTDFTDRRLTPAVRTCESFVRRTRDLLERASWVSALLRTRIETTLENQNRDLLASMNRRALAQLRLQQAVEGLSVIAISYYAVGLTAYASKAATHYFPRIDATVLTGALMPFIVLGTWYVVHRMRRRLTGGHASAHEGHE